MAPATSTPTARPVAALRRQFSQAPGLPFADLLPAEQVEQALHDEPGSFRDRLFSPLVTLWVFLSQCLDPDHSCRAAVARFLAWRACSTCSAGRRSAKGKPGAWE